MSETFINPEEKKKMQTRQGSSGEAETMSDQHSQMHRKGERGTT